MAHPSLVYLNFTTTAIILAMFCANILGFLIINAWSITWKYWICSLLGLLPCWISMLFVFRIGVQFEVSLFVAKSGVSLHNSFLLSPVRLLSKYFIFHWSFLPFFSLIFSLWCLFDPLSTPFLRFNLAYKGFSPKNAAWKFIFLNRSWNRSL